MGDMTYNISFLCIQTLLEYVQSHPVLKDTRLVAYGQSIGGAVAIDIVSHNEEAFSGLIVENTFLSLVSVDHRMITEGLTCIPTHVA